MTKNIIQRILSLFFVGCFMLGCADVFPSAAEEFPQISYEFSNLLPGSADGIVSVRVSDYDGEEYLLEWGTAENIFVDQKPLADVSKMQIRGKLLKYTTESALAIPPQATHLWLTLDGNLLTCYEIPQWKIIPSKAPKYRFGVISDLHFGSSVAVPALQSAMDSFSAQDVSFVLTVGDNTNGGTFDQWKTFSETYAPYKEIPLFITLGNHDALAWNLSVSPEAAMENVKDIFPNYANENHSYGEEFDLSLSEIYPDYDYSFVYKGDLYLVMGIGAASNNSEDRNIDQQLSDLQLDWLDDTLAEYYHGADHGNAFLFFHYYTLESGMTVGSGTEWDRDSSKKLHRVLNKYPGTFYFNGHNHYTFDAEFNIYLGRYFSFHVPSLAYGGILGDKGHKNGKEGYLVEVYDDFVLVRGMDFATGNFVSYAAFHLTEKYKNDAIAYGVTVKKTSSDAVLWKSRKGGIDWKDLTTLGELNTDGTVQSFPCTDGKTVEFRANETHVQWRCPQDPDSSWEDFIALEDLPGKSVVSDAPTTNDVSGISFGNGLWIVLAVCGGVLCLGAAGILFFFLRKKR